MNGAEDPAVACEAVTSHLARGQQSIRFSGHENFACRYAWLPKAYRVIDGNPGAFMDDEKAMVGRNMVRSIRFWVEVMGIAVPRCDKTLELSAFGLAVFGDDGFDPFLEDIRTLWMLHWNLSVGVMGPLFAWDLLLNKWPYAELTRAEALAAFIRESRRLNMSRSAVTLGQHLDVFLHTYVPSQRPRSPTEDSLDCPLAELELLQCIGERRVDGSGRHEPVYSFRRGPKPEITKALFEYCLHDYWQRCHPGEATLTYRDVAIAPCSIGQVLKLPENDVRTRLDVYTEPECRRPFGYQSSAVQGLVSRRDIGEWDFLAAVYTEEAGGG